MKYSTSIMNKSIGKQNNTILFEDWLIDNSEHSLSDVLRRIVIAGKSISAKIRRASIEHLCGSTTITNYHGEEVKMLDVLSNDQFITNLQKSPFVAGMISEEDFSLINTHNKDGKYVVTFDPLDGSSNIDANVNVGSIFGIYLTSSNDVVEKDYLRPGKDLIAAGYILYGSSTILVLSIGKDVHGFCLDDNIGEFVLTHSEMKMPNDKNIYSVNEGNYELWEENIKNMIKYLKSTDKENNKKIYSQRYIGSMVADIHRTLLYGGLFMYPASTSSPNGKLRYLYEVAPMSFLIEQAGGQASINIVSKDITRALDYKPQVIHQRVPIFMGSQKSMDIVHEFLK